MLDLNETYIIDKHKKPVAVQLDIKIFKRIEEVLEDYALVQYMKESDNDTLAIDEAKKFYKKLIKK